MAEWLNGFFEMGGGFGRVRMDKASSTLGEGKFNLRVTQIQT